MTLYDFCPQIKGDVSVKYSKENHDQFSDDHLSITISEYNDTISNNNNSNNNNNNNNNNSNNLTISDDNDNKQHFDTIPSQQEQQQEQQQQQQQQQQNTINSNYISPLIQNSYET